MDNFEAQNEELLVLQSIYEEKDFLVDGMDPPSGRYNASVELRHPFYIKCNDSNSEAGSQIFADVFEVEHLPPINLFFEFPPSYPSHTCPAFFLSCKWLSVEQLSKLCKRLELLWTEGNGEVVLFRWIQFLKEETLDFLHITNSLDISQLSKFRLKSGLSEDASLAVHDSRAESTANFDCVYSKELKPPVPDIQPSITGGMGIKDRRAFVDLLDGKFLKTILKDYNELKKLEIFRKKWHLCNICFLEKRGSDFLIFQSCYHSFCKECLKNYFELQIREGNVHSLNCPEGKCNSQADGSMVRQIVATELFDKYDALLLSRTLESMSDVAYCPRKVCQCPVVIDACGRMGTCPACKFVFCPFCKMGYHGVAPCNFKSEEKQQICDEYLNGNDVVRAELEKRHGKRVIRSLVENNLSEKWMHCYSKNCPHCGASIEKTDGCNKMTCFRCGTFFCWLCMKQLKSSNPYMHYNDTTSKCFDQLFPNDYMDNVFEIEPGEFLNFF